MKININRAAFADVLGLVGSVVPSRTPKPILSCVRITAEKKEVHICATDLEVGINHIVSEVQVEQPGEAVIPADKLSAVVRESDDDVLLLEADGEACHISGADSRFTIFVQPPEQYPQVPGPDGQADMTIELSNLKTGIRQCLFATAKESTRYALNGILWIADGKKLTLVATDGRRLARSVVRLKKAVPEDSKLPQMIVPAKTMALLEKIAGRDKEIISVQHSGSQVLFSTSGLSIASTLVEGNFPKYEEIIPSGYDKKLNLSTATVLSAVRRSALLTSQESRGIRLAVDKGKFVFSCRVPEAGDARVEMVTDYKGKPIEIGFNPQFLIDVLRVIQTDRFEMELGQPSQPGLIKTGADFIYVLMPISID